jgi:hypothetical protein
MNESPWGKKGGRMYRIGNGSDTAPPASGIETAEEFLTGLQDEQDFHRIYRIGNGRDAAPSASGIDAAEGFLTG